jgi:hypothetical protein
MRELIQHIKEAGIFKGATQKELKKRGTFIDTKYTFKVNIWDHIDMDSLNDALDEELYKKGVSPTDITYRFRSINTEGSAMIEAEFIPERIE